MPKKSKSEKTPQQQRDPWRVRWPEDRGATHGDTDRQTLHAAVGLALSEWERLEEELARLFAALVGARWADPAVRAYGSVNNFRGRAAMLDEAAEAFFHSATFRKKLAGPDLLIIKTKANYQQFIKLCKNFASRRNEIAHGKDVNNPRLGYFLKPAAYNSNKYDFEDNIWGAYSYTSVEISEYLARFDDVCLAPKNCRAVQCRELTRSARSRHGGWGECL